MKEIANFFWVGKSLSMYENLSLKSFLLNDFNVRVWTYDEIKVPDGVVIMNAEEILPKSDLYKYKQGGKEKNLAAFSDVFRFKLLSEKNGEWWFDIDCICLNNQLNFKKLKENKKLIVGWEDENFVNGACLNFLDKDLGLYILKKQKIILDNKNDLMWGEIGPRLLTSIINENKLYSEILEKKYFYPIHYTQTKQMNNPNYCNELVNLSQNSYVCHLWNEILSKNIDKNIKPNEGSFLDFLFIKYK